MSQRTTLQRWTRHALALALMSGMVGVAAPASALDMDDIMNMHAVGLDPSTIVNVIRGETAPLQLTAEQVEQLGFAGVPQPVLDELCIRVGCTTAPGAGPGLGGPIGPGGPGGLDMQEEMERQRRLEEDRLRQEQERLAVERERMRQQIEEEQARAAQIASRRQELVEADSLVARNRCDQAAVLYRTFMDELQPAVGTAEHYQALTGFVSSMHCLGYRHVIRTEALQATLYGAQTERFAEMFYILREISNEVRYLDPQIENLTGESVNQYEQRFQNDWNYFLGRFFWQYGDNERALNLLSRIPDSSDDYGQAQYLSGVMLLEDGRNGEAYQTFQIAVVATDGDEGQQDIFELSNLAIARIAFEIQEYDVALFHYYGVGQESRRHLQARYEIAWSYLLKADWDRAVGALHTLHSPDYDHTFWPEVYVLEAFIYLQSCQLETAQDAIYRHEEEHGDMLSMVESYIANSLGPDQTYGDIGAFYDRARSADPVGLPIEAVRFVLSDTDYMNKHGRVVALREELARLQDDIAALGGFAQTAALSLENDLSTATIEAGLRASRLISDFRVEVQDWDVKARELEIEITAARLDMAVDSIGSGAATGNASSSLFVLAQDWQVWPFEGEYWADEVDNFRGALTIYRNDEGRCFEPVDADAIAEMAEEVE
ncbi:MAG: hypothetical protein ACI82G_001146 [Bradymonadia bacterium]|jgi:hypothetical protein